LQARENVSAEQDRRINENQEEILRQRRELEELRRRPEY